MSRNNDNLQLFNFNTPQHFLITGGTGFIGSRLCQQLSYQSHHITLYTRNKIHAQQKNNKNLTLINDFSELSTDTYFDYVINLAGAGIADKRWSQTRKQEIFDSRITTTQSLANLLQRLTVKPKLLVSASAVGYYGYDATTTFTEQSKNGNGFTCNLCQTWEQTAKTVESNGINVAILRLGIVLGKNGGALKKMLPAFRFGIGGLMDSGNQWMSWIHIDDVLGIIHFIMNAQISGAINTTTPNPVTNREFTTILGKILNRPTFAKMPENLLKLIFGEMSELLIFGQRVVPEKLLNYGYHFKYPGLEAALNNIVK